MRSPQSELSLPFQYIKPSTQIRTKQFMNCSQTVRESNARMCEWDCKPVLHHPRMVRIPFAANQNLSVFCANTKRTGCAGCPFHAPGVLCSPQVRGKLITRAPLTCRMRTAQCRSGMLVYTKRYMAQFVTVVVTLHFYTNVKYWKKHVNKVF